MEQSFTAAILAVVLALAAAGRSSASDQAASPESPKKDAAVDSALASVTKAVLADAVAQSGIEKGAVAVTSAETVVWADGSLGCPAHGASYTMAQVPGYRIRVQAGTRELVYHTDRRGYFILCPGERAVDPVGPVAN